MTDNIIDFNKKDDNNEKKVNIVRTYAIEYLDAEDQVQTIEQEGEAVVTGAVVGISTPEGVLQAMVPFDRFITFRLLTEVETEDQSG